MGVFGPSIKKLTASGDVAGLCAALHRWNPNTRLQAIQALGELRDPAAIEDLIEAYRRAIIDARKKPASSAGGNTPLVVRPRVTAALVKIADVRTVPLLAEMARNPRDYSVDAATGLLAGLGDAGIAELISLLETTANRTTDVALIHAGESAVGPLTAILEDQNRPQQLHDRVVFILTRIRTPEATQAVELAKRRKDIAEQERAHAAAEVRRQQRERAEADRRERLAELLATDEVTPAEAALLLAEFYDTSPRGEGFLKGDEDAEPVRAIGRKLNDRGGKDEMLEAHGAFARLRPRAARNLENVWDGIGTWMG